MSKYEVLDKAIMAKMGGHPQTFSAILVRDVRQECERIALAEPGEVLPYRILDRRLQALRRAEKVRFTSKGWVHVQQRVA